MEPLCSLVNISCQVTVDFAKGEGYIVIKQLVTVHCSFLYFELVPIIILSTKAYSNVEFCVTKNRDMTVASTSISVVS